ncbi:hypothetical protein [uncultured Sunxiuqinia sp.]|uniref:hypothetical protein n=1 Tax=uncultured Sunxiuqinia sp. TaxID=1573825 RepID=UPI002AA6A84A|nr:hypothetical protein [uncultured Sunxiuqinia sp.]
MMFKKLACIGLFLMLGDATFAQSDSTKLSPVNLEYEFIYMELFNFSPNSTFGELQFNQTPAISKEMNWQPSLFGNLNTYASFKSISLSNHIPSHNPFLNALSVTSYADYKLSDKLIFGGNSFAGNSIFNPLPANPSVQDMSIRGASMFLQYKISDKFKVSGSFSISNQEHPLIP